MNNYKKILSFLLCLTISLPMLLSGCSEKDFDLYFGVDELPKTVDPQRVSLYSEILTVKNCFTGLTRLDEDGDAILGVANRYTISDDGLTYTFTLGNNEWYNGDDVTAYDFEFAVERACRPETKTTGAEYLLNIVGAKELLNGDDADLGFYADGSDTVVIKLITPDSNMLIKLTQPVFMPCNEEFFENSKGKYGLGTDYILSNGMYKVHSWSTKSNFVRLMRVGKGNKKISDAKSVYISKGTSGKNSVTRINDGEVGMTLDVMNDFSSVSTSKYNIETLYTKNYVLVFNKNSELGANNKITEAFATSVDFDNLSSGISNRFEASRFVLPENAILNGNVLDSNSLSKENYFEYSNENSRKLFLEGVSKLKDGKFPKVSVLTVDNTDVKSALNYVISGWQKNLGAYVNVETISSEASLLERVKSGDYKIALIPINPNTSEALELFASGGGADIKSEEYNGFVSALEATHKADDALSLLNNALDLIQKDSSVIPLFSSPATMIWDSAYKNVIFNKIDLTVDFSWIYK